MFVSAAVNNTCARNNVHLGFSCSQETHMDSPHDGRSKHRKSPSEEPDESWEWERERSMDRKEKKREHPVDDYDADNKRRKSKQNGEANGSSKGYSEREHKEKSKTGHSSRREMYVEADEPQKIIKVKEKRDKVSSKKQKK